MVNRELAALPCTIIENLNLCEVNNANYLVREFPTNRLRKGSLTCYIE